jgi:ABC-type phosphate transport system substrate-binding protein
MRTYKKLIAVGAMAATAAAVAVVPAIADPPRGVTPSVKSIVGVGSDTIQFVFDQFSNDYNKTKPARPLYSWDAVNPKTGAVLDKIVSKRGCPKEPRPNGSTGGLQPGSSTGSPISLGANLKDPKGGFCTDFARSSRPTAAGDPPKANFIPFATDAVTWATNATTHAPASLTVAQLAKIYSCTVTNWKQVGGTSGHINAQLPQSGSGTLKFFLTEIGVATPGGCVGSTAEENEGINPVLKGKGTIFPYSVADYIAQTLHSAKCGAVRKPGQNLFGCDDHGSFVLHKIAGVSPTVSRGRLLNPKFPFTRLVFVVVRGPGVPAYEKALFGLHGWVLTNKTAAKDICAYGFATLGKRGC